MKRTPLPALAALLLAPLSLSAQEFSPCARRVALEKKFNLKAGECAVAAKELEIRFLKVTQDSRCPADASCIWAGSATALFLVKKKGAQPAELLLERRADGASASAVYQKHEIHWLELKPAPSSRKAIPATEYKATLRVSAAKTGAGENAFVGHYGYLVSYPSAFSAQPSFQGPIEVVQFMPPAPCSQDQLACAKAGWVNLSVFPKKLIKDANGLYTYAAFMDAVLKDSKANGEKPEATPMKAGGLSGTLFALETTKAPFDRLVYLDGKKCYYRFAYDSTNKNAEKIVQGLAEVQPHDDPPPALNKTPQR